ncbi:RidA family protein [Ornithinibacillus californiensis]|uniref:RidA family protein n=1 Tax=Ornithinibacillus californiensis TaxID=161536 RepID=UPI00064DB460|nr:RidA family protein [Ornithinibacillus californiensis]
MRKAFNSKTVSASGPYSHAVDTGDFVYLSGQTAKNTGSQTTSEDSKEDITSQTKQCFINLQSVLDEVDLDESNVVKVNVFLTSMDYFAEMNEVYQTFFSEPYPARTCVAVKELPLGADVEIELIAKRK